MKRFLLALALGWGLIAPASAVITQTPVGNAAYTILSTDQTLFTTTVFTAARTWTLPSAGATCIGQSCPATMLQILDLAGAYTSTNTLTLAPASGETINGNAANLIINAAGARVILIPTSGSNWQAVIEGDYIASAVVAGSAVSLTTNTAANITTVSLSQGDWECRGLVSRTLGGTTSVTVLSAGIGTTTATIPTQGTNAVTNTQTAANVMGATGQDSQVGPARFSLAATTTVYLVAKDTFTVSTDAGYGELACRRIR